jgi:hypothetical protein
LRAAVDWTGLDWTGLESKGRYAPRVMWEEKYCVRARESEAVATATSPLTNSDSISPALTFNAAESINTRFGTVYRGWIR